MADAQFIVYNDAGIEQVSLGGINLAMVNKRVISIGNWTAISAPRSNGLKYSFSFTAVNPVIAISSTAAGAAGAVFPLVVNTGGNNWTITLYAGASTPTTATPGNKTLTGTVTVYVFDNAPAPTSGPGLALFDSNGRCIFNASYPCARVKQFVGTTQNPYGYPTSIAVPSGKTYACVVRSTWGQMFTESYNNTTGDRIVYDWRFGVSGGASGVAVQMGTGFSCLLDGAVSTRAGSGAAGNMWLQYGCNSGSSGYFGDAMVLDVTGL